MAAEYHLDYAAFGEHVLNASWMEARMRSVAEEGHAIADATAPFDADDPDGVHYRDQFEVSSGKHGGIHGDRAWARLENNDVTYDRNGKPFSVAHAVEFGNVNTPAHHTVFKAMRAAAGA